MQSDGGGVQSQSWAASRCARRQITGGIVSPKFNGCHGKSGCAPFLLRLPIAPAVPTGVTCTAVVLGGNQQQAVNALYANLVAHAAWGRRQPASSCTQARDEDAPLRAASQRAVNDQTGHVY